MKTLRKKIRIVLRKAYEHGFFNHPENLKDLDNELLSLFDAIVREVIGKMESGVMKIGQHETDDIEARARNSLRKEQLSRLRELVK